MLAITHSEVRRHPRWHEEPGTPVPSPDLTRRSGALLVGAAFILIAVVAVAILILKGWVLSLRD